MRTSLTLNSVLWCAFLTALLGAQPAVVMADDDPSNGDSAADAQDEAAAEKKTADTPETTEPAKPDPYTVPDGDAAAMIAFIEKLEAIRPNSREEFMEIVNKRAPAVSAAFDKLMAAKPSDAQVLQAVKSKLSALQLKSRMDAGAGDQVSAFIESLKENKVPGIAEVVLQHDVIQKIRDWANQSAEAKAQAVNDQLELFAKEKIGPEQAQLAMGIGQVLEHSDDSADRKLAIDYFTKLGPLFEKSDNPGIVRMGQSFEATIRRLNLMGNPIDIKGSLIDGSEFDWASYKGKVVLVDFWATWCGPCIQELPNVIENYERYHDKGFDVIGISLDDADKKDQVEQFVKEREIAWPILFSSDPENSGWKNPTAAYYGISGIPTVILVNQEGKVVSLNARGPKLGEELEKLLGKADAPAAEAPVAKKDS